MASEVDGVSILTNELDSVSLSNLYKEEWLPEKGVGCIALADLKEGDLVLREVPQLLHPVITDVNFTHEDSVRHHVLCVEAFIEMSKEDQKSYLELYDYFDSDRSTWSSVMEEKYALRQMLANLMERFLEISSEEALKVMTIMDTNGFHNGVCLKMSRFNHSCQPNAQYFWNEDTNTRDVRALRDINQGEEITFTYSPDIAGSIGSRKERRARLKEDFNFDCNCNACDLTEEEILREAEILENYREEMQRRKDLHDSTKLVTNGSIAQALMQSELKCLRSMHEVAKEIKSFHPRILLNDIIEEAFHVAAAGVAGCCDGMETTKVAWTQDASLFADMGLQLATTLNGAGHSVAKKWNERVVNPMAAVEDQPGSRGRDHDLTEDEVEEEIKKIDEYKKEKLRKEGFQEANKNAPNRLTSLALMRSEFESLTKMYQIAEKIKTFNRRVFLKEIVEEAFDVSVQGALSAQQSVFTAAGTQVWMKDAHNFANIGLQMATKSYGAEHLVTKEWAERSADPEQFFLREFGGAMRQIPLT